VQHPQDNRSNMVKNLENERIASKIASQQTKKQVQHENDENVEYARSIFLNARKPHIKSEIGYKTGDNYNSRVNTRDQEFIKRRSKESRPLIMLLILILTLLMFLIYHIIILMLLMCL
jgi:hypothetical protein